MGGGVVLVVDDIAHPVEGLQRPVVADVAGEPGWAGVLCGQAGDAGYRHRRLGAVGVGDVAFDEEHLLDVRERQVGRGR